ncbi:MAG: NAD(+) synthase [Clostridiales bacterium]|nr:NAD(+) synthase [Clostridiales bacterium]
MKDGFIRVAACTPQTRVTDIEFNCKNIVDSCIEAAEKDCSLIVFPELSITGYTCGDLFLHDAFISRAFEGLTDIAEKTAELNTVIVVGLPVSNRGKLYNCAAVISQGEILGFVPKINIPNYSEFYEMRHFTPYADDIFDLDDIPFGRLVFENSFYPEFCFACEICEDMWVPNTPSSEYAMNGAMIICNLSASDEVIGKAEYRKKLISAVSGVNNCAYIYSDCGMGESTQDLIFAGVDIICENGTILAESKRYTGKPGIIYSDIDLKKLAHERQQINTFETDETVDRIFFETEPVWELELEREFPKHPFVPAAKYDLEKRCEEIISMQAMGLATRLKHINCSKAVIGLSGGLDSTLALIVTVHAFDMLDLDRKGILAITMPGFGTTDRTKNNSLLLAERYGASIQEISIAEAVKVHFKDIGQDMDNHDVTYENGQARERTQVLMDIANKTGGIVVGTGDLSELALGWATYNGDHMSMYGVNCSIPKTLVRHLVSYEASRTEETDKDLSDVLKDIVDTPVSPELLPPTDDGKISQKTEDLVGPYELHDFFLYYFLRFSYAPSKIFRIAKIAFDGIYDEETIYKWEETFVRRFFTQQFKRSCVPDGPKVGTVCLSPRGDWRMPSDATSKIWLEDLLTVKP